MDKRQGLLDLLRSGEILSAENLEERLGIAKEHGQVTVRKYIDYWRAKSEPIWHDMNGRFWWRDDKPVSPVGTRDRWKRPFEV